MAARYHTTIAEICEGDLVDYEAVRVPLKLFHPVAHYVICVFCLILLGVL